MKNEESSREEFNRKRVHAGLFREWTELDYARAAYQLAFQIMSDEQIETWKRIWIAEFEPLKEE